MELRTRGVIVFRTWTRKSCTRSGIATPNPPIELWWEKPRKCSGSSFRVKGGAPTAPLKVVVRNLRENGLVLSFPYVCPEPVLVKSTIVSI